MVESSDTTSFIDRLSGCTALRTFLPLHDHGAGAAAGTGDWMIAMRGQLRFHHELAPYTERVGGLLGTAMNLGLHEAIDSRGLVQSVWVWFTDTAVFHV